MTLKLFKYKLPNLVKTRIGDKMKKLDLVLVFIFLLIMNTSCSQKNSSKRLRIIADDNTRDSIEEKMMIKNVIKSAFDSGQLNFDKCNVINLEELLKIELPNYLYEKINIEKCISYYPAKSYHQQIIPSGNYETILITIGKGNGNNFWTLLYPEYYGLEFEENNEIEYRSYFYDLFNKQIYF